MRHARSPARTLNALGFCVGGTLLACALAVLAARKGARVASATFLTTMLDFADPGEIGVYIAPESLAAREPALLSGQRVQGSELAGAFASLRPNDLVWNYVVNNYLKGAHAAGVRPAVLERRLVESAGTDVRVLPEQHVSRQPAARAGALTMLGEAIDLARVKMPAYVFASRDDHIVPWASAYRTPAPPRRRKTFVLGASGHIAGVVNPPAGGKRNYWTSDTQATNPDDWLASSTSHPGSWWPHWYRVARHARGRQACSAL